MATSNSKPNQVLFACTFLAFILLLLHSVNSLDQLSFTFNKFVPNQRDLIFQGNATVSSTGVLRLTKLLPYSIGRALYAAPMQIWDRNTKKVASFSTSFSFLIQTPEDAYKPSHGLAFFLAPLGYPLDSSMELGYLGLVDNSDYDSSRQVVAVELDTYSNSFDPSGQHIGIDVNSINSTKTVAWDLKNDTVANVIITYLAPTKMLTVSLTYPDQTSYIISASVDLKAILPEWVTVGFSAASAKYNYNLETHDVLHWYFTSTWEANNYAAMENNVYNARYTA